jgi:ATP-dependent RNA helicase RhlE
LNPILQSTIASVGFDLPTPIQQQAIPFVLEGRDVMGLANTGTGKTAAFVLPILQRLLEVRGASAQRARSPRALVIAPTRELAEQIHSVAQQFATPLGLESVSIYGGVSVNRQIQALRSGVDIVIGCPGRLLDLMQQRALNTSRLEVVVLDEADHMFDMGFLPTIRQILKNIPSKRQTLLFSATMPPEIRKLATQILNNPKTVEVGHLSPVASVDHALYPVPQVLKSDLLIALLQKLDKRSVLVFTRTKHRAKRLGEQLIKGGFKAASLQGNLSQNRRMAAMSGFRDGSIQILVATDIAARGVDIATVSHVINFDIPDTTEAYTHRVGRTGRASREGDAITFVAPEDAAMVRAIERVMKETIEQRTLEGFNYSSKPSAPVAQAGSQRRNDIALRGRSSSRSSNNPRQNNPRHADQSSGSRRTIHGASRGGSSAPQQGNSRRQGNSRQSHPSR